MVGLDVFTVCNCTNVVVKDLQLVVCITILFYNLSVLFCITFEFNISTVGQLLQFLFACIVCTLIQILVTYSDLPYIPNHAFTDNFIIKHGISSPTKTDCIVYIPYIHLL